MSDMLRVTMPVAPKEYGMNQNVKPQAPEQVFELGNVEYINKANTRDEQLGEQNLKDGGGTGLPTLRADIAKDPAMSAVLLKGLVSGAAMDILRQSGNAELLNKVTEFAGEIMLLPNADEVAADIIRQQEEATVFSDPLWSELKNMLTGLNGDPVGEELAAAVLDFAKATASAGARESILTSISESLRYLAGETAQSREIMNLLNQTADRLNADNFSEVKQDVLSLVNYLQDSLLLNDKTQNLLSLITYNLSRFNNSSSAVAESFRAVASMTGDPETAQKLETLFAKFIETSRLPPDVKLAAMEDSHTSSAAMSMTMLAERVANAVENSTKNMSPEQLDSLTGELQELTKELQELTQNAQNNQTTETVVTRTEENGETAQTTETTVTAGKAAIDIKQGVSFLRRMIAPLVQDSMRGGVNTLLRNFENEKDLNTLIDRLSVIVNRIDNPDAKIAVAQSVNQVLSQMALAEGINYKPPTTMENMLDFLVKNINDPSLKSLSAMNRGEMLQGLLTSPGVFSPLLHFLVPMNMDGTKAFGELWADPDAGDGKPGGDDDKHLFLCFEIEEAGYFELEVYSHGRDINVSLLCPEGSERQYLPLKETIPVIASANGYNAEKTIISPLKKKRDLNKVFPKLNDRKNNLNVTA
ncbi:MAG: hypothetical protein NC253_00035 [Ruminococcus sp.]|nr:hypothetical protein [Ruminococcus sp.]MCM1478124.1 hypothetical protein [Muribaculaceae bacterium]